MRALTEWLRFAAGGDRLARHDVPEVAVARDLERARDPAPDASSSSVSSVMPCGVGSPDRTPWLNVPPRSSLGRASASTAVWGARTRAAPAEPPRVRNWRRESIAAQPNAPDRIAAMPHRLLLVAALLALALVPAAHADTTLRHRIAPAGGTGYQPLKSVKGERYVVRRGAGAKARTARAHHRRSLALFAQLTDPQIADEMSPARVDFADPAGGEIKSSWRPQEALGLQVFDSVVRAVNANRRSPVAQGNGKRARLGFALTTGDLADNQQLNETTLVPDRPRRRPGRPVLRQADRQLQRVQRRDDRRDRARSTPTSPRAATPASRTTTTTRRRAGRPQGRLLGPRRRAARQRRPVRRVPALPRPARARAGPVHRPRA